jgi:hypothetical protein
VLLAVGCLETEEEYTLNPDGSGKVVVKAIMRSTDMMGNQNVGTEKELKSTVRKILSESKGVETWKDVSYKRMDDGRIYFEGTAYFADMSKLELKFGDTSRDMLKPAFKKGPGGETLFELGGDEDAGSGEQAPPKKLTDEQVDKEIKAARAQYQQMKPMMSGFFKGMKIKNRYHLPGTLEKVSNFKKAADGALEITMEGEKLLKAFDKRLNDDDWCKKQVKAGRNLLEDEGISSELNEDIFGEKGPIRAVLKGEIKPLFDYKTEVEAARKAFPEMVKKLDIRGVVPAEPAKGGGFKSLKVGGVRMVRLADMENDTCHFSQDVGYSLSLEGEFPGSVLKIKEAVVEKAIADNGENLLPQREWDRKAHFPRLSKDKTKVVFEVRLKLPSEKVTGLKEVSGSLVYIVSGGTKNVDIGLKEFKPGAAGKEFGAKIEAIAESQWQKGHQNMSLAVELEPEAVKAVVFRDADGKVLDVSRSGYMASGGTTTYNFTIKGKFPEKGSITVEAYEDLKKHKIEFKIENVSLLGQPLK